MGKVAKSLWELLQDAKSRLSSIDSLLPVETSQVPWKTRQRLSSMDVGKPECEEWWHVDWCIDFQSWHRLEGLHRLQWDCSWRPPQGQSNQTWLREDRRAFTHGLTENLIETTSKFLWCYWPRQTLCASRYQHCTQKAFFKVPSGQIGQQERWRKNDYGQIDGGA